MDDPYAVLGLTREASLEEAGAAWRRLAKEWHPDLRGDAHALARMTELNAAYEQLLAEHRSARAGSGAGSAAGNPNGRSPGARDPRASGRERGGGAARSGLGWWLPAPVRRALGPELLRALTEREAVREIVPCHASGSSALLVLTERRLMWLLDDLVLGRVRALPLTAIEKVERPRSRPWRRGMALRVRGAGQGVTFAGLTAEAADRLTDALGAVAAP